MRITVVAMSGRGDTEPFLALAVRLQGAGHQVRLAGRPDFAELVSAHGVEFAPVGSPYQPFIAGAAAANAVGSGHPLRKVLYGIRQRRYVTDSVHDGTQRACQDADAVIFKYPLITAQTVAESLGIPCVGVMLLPFLPTRQFPSFIMGRGIDRGPILNQLVWKLPWQLIWQGLRLDDRKLRRRLQLDPLPMLAPAPFRQQPDAPVLCAWSQAVLPIPADWPSGVHACGYWFLDPAPRWQPPDDLLRFLDTGPPPVSIGFGSMVTGDPDATLTLVLDALARAGQRGVLLGGWDGLGERAKSLPPDVYPAATLPHSWLFPRTAAVVHHGGAGTTAAALRAGVPAIITPFLADQPSWARTVQALGAGPEPIPFPDLSAERLARAIREAVETPNIRDRAAELGVQLQAEDGLRRMNLPPMAGHLPGDGGGCWDGIWWPEAAAVFGGVQAEHAVALWRRSGKSIAEVAHELGVNDMSLGLWIKKSDESSPTSEQERADRDEAARLRKRVKELEEEVEILKRFTAYWVKDSGR